jgi:hypothetical protein
MSAAPAAVLVAAPHPADAPPCAAAGWWQRWSICLSNGISDCSVWIAI